MYTHGIAAFVCQLWFVVRHPCECAMDIAHLDATWDSSIVNVCQKSTTHRSVEQPLIAVWSLFSLWVFLLLRHSHSVHLTRSHACSSIDSVCLGRCVRIYLTSTYFYLRFRCASGSGRQIEMCGVRAVVAAAAAARQIHCQVVGFDASTRWIALLCFPLSRSLSTVSLSPSHQIILCSFCFLTINTKLSCRGLCGNRKF